MLLTFGSGALFGTPLTDAFGVTVANPTPIQFGVLQEASVDISFDVKELFGQNQFPVAVGRGKGKISGKSKFAQMNGLTLNSLFFGQTIAAGVIAEVADTTGALVPTTPFTITPVVPSSGTWVRDLGVQTAARVPMKRVASAPVTGQYSVTAGAYLFAAADVGQLMYINFNYSATSTIAQKSTVTNVAMGYAPTFICDLYTSYQGKSLTLTLSACIATKLTFATKLDDFVIPEFDFSAFADAGGNVMQYSLSE